MTELHQYQIKVLKQLGIWAYCTKEERQHFKSLEGDIAISNNMKHLRDKYFDIMEDDDKQETKVVAVITPIGHKRVSALTEIEKETLDALAKTSGADWFVVYRKRDGTDQVKDTKTKKYLSLYKGVSRLAHSTNTEILSSNQKEIYDNLLTRMHIAV